jgi:riboflavin synthase alpha subunit
MISYKIIESTVPHFVGIEMPYDFSACKVGDSISILGLNLSVTQCGEQVVGCSNSDNVLIFQKVNP